MFFRKKTAIFEPAPLLKVEAGIVLANVQVEVESATGRLAILSSFNLTLTKQRTAILGLNGSGKSTFLKTLNGLQGITSGRVEVGSLDTSNNLDTIRQRVGLLFANPQAQLVMPTAQEDVELSLQKQFPNRDQRKEAAQKYLRMVGMEHRAHHSVYDLSGGEKQLVALATVLAVEPQYLLLDEPTTLLDQRNRFKLYELLASLPQRLVISTHDLELAATCDEAVVIHQGKVIAQGLTQDIIAKYTHWCASEFPTSNNETGA